MTHLLPPNLLKLFAPRAPLAYYRPLDKDIERVTLKDVGGVADFLARVREESTQDIIAAGREGMEEGEEPTFTLAEETKREVRREERRKKKEEEFRLAKETYKPNENSKATKDPYRTLFIGRLSKNASENDLRREFEAYGPIEEVKIIRDKKGRSRGYGFVIYERERDMKAAYKDTEGMQILGKRILVDVERGRTVRGWQPRRLGGGLGGRPKPVVAVAPPVVHGGGFRGGGRGGFGDRGGGFRGGRGGFGGGFRSGRGGGGFGDRGGDFGGPLRGGFGDRGGPGGPGSGFQGRGGGIGFQGGRGGGGGFNDQSNGYGGPPGGGRGGYGFRGGFGGELKRDGPSDGYDDRDPKRMRRF